MIFTWCNTIYDTTIKLPIVSSYFLWSLWLILNVPFVWMITPILFLLWISFLLNPIFYKNRKRLINEYKNLFDKFIKKELIFRFRFIYLNWKNVKKDKYIWKKPFIESKVEKVWI